MWRPYLHAEADLQNGHSMLCPFRNGTAWGSRATKKQTGAALKRSAAFESKKHPRDVEDSPAALRAPCDNRQREKSGAQSVTVVLTHAVTHVLTPNRRHYNCKYARQRPEKKKPGPRFGPGALRTDDSEPIER